MAKMSNNFYYCITTNEISDELSPKNMISSQMKRSLLLWLHDEFCLSQPKVFLSEIACSYFIGVSLLNYRTLLCHLEILNFSLSVGKYFMSEGVMIVVGKWL